MQLTINIPDSVPLTLNKDSSELSQIVKINTALLLFKDGKFSIEQASNFADLSINRFMQECKKNKIAVIDYEGKELKNELKLMAQL